MKTKIQSFKKNPITIDSTQIYGKNYDTQIEYGATFLRRNRDLASYLNKNKIYINGKLKIHKSVIQPLEKGMIPKFKRFEKKKNLQKGIIKKTGLKNFLLMLVLQSKIVSLSIINHVNLLK